MSWTFDFHLNLLELACILAGLGIGIGMLIEFISEPARKEKRALLRELDEKELLLAFETARANRATKALDEVAHLLNEETAKREKAAQEETGA